MKRLLIFIFIFCSLLTFSQKKYYIIFNNTTDKIYYENNKSIKFFKIFINNLESVNFVLSDIKSNYQSNYFKEKSNLKRSQLSNILKKDSPNNQQYYIITVKRGKTYYFYYVDHIVRTISD